MDKEEMKKTRYKTNLKEVEKILEHADEDNRVIIEDEDKVLVIVGMSKKKFGSLLMRN